MVINTKSWHYKLWAWNYDFWDTRLPSKTNLCFYTQVIFWSTLVSCMIIGICGVAVVVISTIYYAFSPVALLFGYRPCAVWSAKSRSRCGSDLYIEYDSPVKLGGLGIYPGHLTALLGLIWFHWWGYHHHVLGFAIGDGSIVAIALFIAFLFWYHDEDSETSRLVRATLSAKKERICPMVEFKKEPTSQL